MSLFLKDNWTFYLSGSYSVSPIKTKTIEKDGGFITPSEVSAKETFTLA